MAKTKISEFSATPGNNTDIDGINIAEGCAPSGINDAIRELMAQLKDWQAGTSNDPYVVGSSGSLTLSYGTANGVPYLNGSKVLTTGSALTFDGTNLGIGNSNPTEKLEVVNTSGAVTARIWSSTNTSPIASLEFQRGTNATWGADAYGDYRIRNDTGALLFQYGENGTTTEQMRLNASGNLGLGVTPSAWGSTAKAIQVSTVSALWGNADSTFFSNNVYFDGSNRRYLTNGYAAEYRQADTDGKHVWKVAASGTAGNTISFTEAMTLDASGNLGIGTTSFSNRLTVAGTGTVGRFISSNTGVYIGLQTSDANGVYIGSVSNSMIFQTADTERARIDSSGRLLVGTTSGIANGTFCVKSNYAGAEACSFQGGSNNFIVTFHNTSGTLIGSITGSNGSTTSYNTSSDYRLKEDIQPMTGALTKVAALKPVTYKWKADGSDGQGFIAHELAEVCPDAVSGEKDEVNEDGSIKPQGIDTSFLVATLTAAIQELKAINDAQAQTITVLTARVTALEAA